MIKYIVITINHRADHTSKLGVISSMMFPTTSDSELALVTMVATNT